MKNKKMIMSVVFVSFALVISLIASSVIAKNKEEKVVYKEKIVYQTKQHVIEDIKKNENIVFLGDSITDFYPIDSIYKDLPIIKSGISGYETKDILSRLNEMVYQYNPTKVFLLIGTNDIMFNGEANYQEAVNKIIKIIEEIHKNRSKTEIYLESIYPVRPETNPTMVRERNNDIIKKMNQELKEYCEKKDFVTYIDMYAELKDENDDFAVKYSNDGLHPNDLGYARISQVRLNYIYGID